MERAQVRQWESQCIQEQAPACTAACPMHVDARKMMESLGKGNFKEALKTFATSIPLPRTLACVCDRPCEASCRRNEAGDALSIAALERASLEFGGPPAAPRRQLQKQQRVAIVGGGLSGVSAAIDLAVKGYEITLYEASGELLPRMRRYEPAALPTEYIDADLQALEALQVQVRLGALITLQESSHSLRALTEHFDAIYLACGVPFDLAGAAILEKNDDGRIALDPITYATSHPKVFAAGTLRYAPAAHSPINSVADGRYAAISIDRLLQGASLTANRENQGAQKSRLYTNTSDFVPLARINAATPGARYSREEAQQEAQRCFPCSCMECVKVCEYLKEYRSYPKRYVREIYNNLSIIMGMRNQNRMINSCSLCGLCEAVCPEKLSMGEVCRVARETMVETSKMPASAHDFALRDMAFSTGEAFAMARHQPGHSSSAALFFPGCQLAASSPEHVQSCYEFLCDSHTGGVGLVLNCCGAPALWAGRKELFAQSLEALRHTWREMGQPKIITACSSCFRTFREHAPELPVESLWPHLNQKCVAVPVETAGREFAIHDPCATRGVAEVEGGARELMQRMGVQAHELNPAGQTTCCGYGGLARFVNPALTEKTLQRRMAQSSADFVTYCAMCRDSFARQDKRALHLLDLLFAREGHDAAARPDPGFSQRQENRAHLKSRLLRELWGEGGNAKHKTELAISAAVRSTMEQRMILDEDVRLTIDHAEASGEKIKHPATGHWLASHCPACVTYWVEYAPAVQGYTVFNAYSHRMQVR